MTKALYVRFLWRMDRYLGPRLFVVHSRVLDPNVPDDDIPESNSVRLIERNELIGFSRDPSLDMSESFVVEACARGDVCFGYLEQGSLVAYEWIGSAPTRAEGDLWVRFGEGYSHSYEALTLPSSPTVVTAIGGWDMRVTSAGSAARSRSIHAAPGCAASASLFPTRDDSRARARSELPVQKLARAAQS